MAAWPPELAGLEELCRDHKQLDRACDRASVGVGLVEAGMGATRAIAARRPTHIIFVGTAGHYPGAAFLIGSAAVIRRTFLVCPSVVAGVAYLPAPLPTRVDSDRALRADIRKARRLPVADAGCPLAITRSAHLARRLRTTTGADLENLELFAVARACVTAGIPFAAVLGISNQVGPRAHEQWRDHAASAASQACQAVTAWLTARG